MALWHGIGKQATDLARPGPEGGRIEPAEPESPPAPFLHVSNRHTLCPFISALLTHVHRLFNVLGRLGHEKSMRKFHELSPKFDGFSIFWDRVELQNRRK